VLALNHEQEDFMKPGMTTTASAAPRVSALAELDAAAQRDLDAAAAKVTERVARRRAAALEDARAFFSEWTTLGTEVAAWGAGDPLIRDQHLTPRLQSEVDACLVLAQGLDEEIGRRTLSLDARIAELETLDPATGAARLEEIVAALREEPTALAAARRTRLSWYGRRKGAAAALLEHATKIYGLVKLVKVPAALFKRAAPPEEAA